MKDEKQIKRQLKQKERMKRFQERNVRVRFWYSNEEYEAIGEKAALAGLTMSEFVKRSALNKKISSREEIILANALAKLGGLQLKLKSDFLVALEAKNNEDVALLIADHQKIYREIHNALRLIKGDV